MKPNAMKFDFGQNMYGQLVTGKRETDYTGRTGWKITIHAANQRDDTRSIHGVTDEQMLLFAAAVKVCTR